MPTPFKTVNVGGIPFQITDLESATNWLLLSSRELTTERYAVRLANAYCVALAKSETAYAHLLATKGVNFPDGVPVVVVMRALSRGKTLPRRVRGPSLFREVLKEGVVHNTKHFFIGSTEATLQRLVRAVADLDPDIRVEGTYAPPFSSLNEKFLGEIIVRARTSNADIIWVGMGSPKQDYVTQALAEQAGLTAVGVGAAFDFMAGNIKEAPRWMQRSGLEWSYRLAKEPQRLWRRYLFGNATYVKFAIPQVFSGGATGLKRILTR